MPGSHIKQADELVQYLQRLHLSQASQRQQTAELGILVKPVQIAEYQVHTCGTL